MAQPGRNSKRKPDGPGHERGRPGSDAAGRQSQTPEAEPAAERGERIDTGKTIARGGKTGGTVPGAEPDDR
jgi:hypothetical protein